MNRLLVSIIPLLLLFGHQNSALAQDPYDNLVDCSSNCFWRALPYAILANAAYEQENTIVETNQKTYNFYKEFDKNDTSGLYAVALISSDNSEVVVAFRGSEPSFSQLGPDWLFTDLWQAASSATETQQYSDALLFVSQIIVDDNLSNMDITLVGHSLGGSIATYASNYFASEDTPITAYTIGTAALNDSASVNPNASFKHFILISDDELVDPVPGLAFRRYYGTYYKVRLPAYLRPDDWVQSSGNIIAWITRPLFLSAVADRIDIVAAAVTAIDILHDRGTYTEWMAIWAEEPLTDIVLSESSGESNEDFVENLSNECANSSACASATVENANVSEQSEDPILQNYGADANIKDVEVALDGTNDYKSTLEVETGDRIHIETRVNNEGDALYDEPEVSFYIDGGERNLDCDRRDLVDTDEIDDLEPGDEHKEGKFTNAPDDPGVYWVYSCIRSDITGDIDTSNNKSKDSNRDEWVKLIVKPRNFLPEGYVDALNCDSAIGWARDADKTGGGTKVHVYSLWSDNTNKTFQGEVVADQYRGDAQLQGNYGFTWNLPQALKNGRARRYEFYAINEPQGDNPQLTYVGGVANQFFCAEPIGDTYPLFRFYSSRFDSHFYTISEAETTQVLSDGNWGGETVAMYAYNRGGANRVGVRRFVRTRSNGYKHFYVREDSPELSNLIADSQTQFPTDLSTNSNWYDEGTVFYVPTFETTAPVYRYWSESKQSHFYTQSLNEISGDDGGPDLSAIYTYEGIVFYGAVFGFDEPVGQVVPPDPEPVPIPVESTVVDPPSDIETILEASPLINDPPESANQAPQITEVRPTDTYSLTTGETMVIGVTVDDEDVNTLIYSANSLDPSFATISPQGTGAFLLSAIAPGATMLTLTVTDSDGLSDSATVTVDVSALNRTPVARDDVYILPSTASPTDLAVTANDFDPDGDALEIVLVTSTSNLSGQLLITGASVLYTPPVSLSQDDQFEYTVRDTSGSISDTATVSIGLSDVDGDDIADAADNCQIFPNANQSDLDTDGLGDDCDIDPDGDGQIGQSGQEFNSGETLFREKCLVCHLAETIPTPVIGNRGAWDAHIVNAGGINVIIGSVLSGKGSMLGFGATHTAKELTEATLFLSGRETQISYGINTANPTQNDPLQAALDLDLDDVADAIDNCPRAPNSDQSDADSDGIGDACEQGVDNDGDGIPVEEDSNDADATTLPGDTDGGDDTSVVTSADNLALGDVAQTSSENSGVNTGVELDDEEFIEAAGEIFPDVTPSLDTQTASASGIFNVDVRLTDSLQAEFLIRLTTDIPLNPLLRVYEPQSGLWSDFSASDNDTVKSAQSVDGSCPALTSSNYRTGLNTGWDCVKLSVSDGGLNDADREVNSVVSIIARLASEQVTDDATVLSDAGSSSSSGGGGKLSLYFILILLLTTGIRQVAVHRKYTTRFSQLS